MRQHIGLTTHTRPQVRRLARWLAVLIAVVLLDGCVVNPVPTPGGLGAAADGMAASDSWQSGGDAGATDAGSSADASAADATSATDTGLEADTSLPSDATTTGDTTATGDAIGDGTSDDITLETDVLAED